MGGFVALMLAARLAGAAAIAEIPRVDLERYPFKTHRALLEEAVLGRSLEEFRRANPERLSVVDRFVFEGRVPPFTLVTNRDDYGYAEHVALLRGLDGLRGVERLGAQRIVEVSTAVGHHPLGKQEALGLIEEHYAAAGPAGSREPSPAPGTVPRPGVPTAESAGANPPGPKETHMNHYISIRWSLLGVGQFEDEGERERWIAARAQIFRQCTAPSLLRQTVRPRAVFVLMDSGDRRYWDEFLALPAPFVPLFIGTGEINSAPAAYIRDSGDLDVVLTRLDSDDALADNYLEEIGKTALAGLESGRESAYIVACNGFRTDFRHIQAVYYECTPFQSVYAHHYDGQGIYAFNHMNVHERDPLLNQTALWLQVIHGRNHSNRIRTRRCRHDPDREIHNGSALPVELAWPLAFLPVWDPRSPRPAARPEQAGAVGSADL
jgi:hypothetical protein